MRYLLTLKGRPPFRMAGIEMYQGLREVCDCLEVFIAHIPDECLILLQHALSEAFKCFTDDCDQLSEVAGWLIHISMLLDSDENPSRTGDEVEKELVEYLDQLLEQNKENPTLFMGSITCFFQIDHLSHYFINSDRNPQKYMAK